MFHCHPNLRDVPGLYELKFPIRTRISNWNTAKGNRGTVAMEIEKFSEFAREVGSYRESEAGVYIKELPWKCCAEIGIDEKSNEKWLGFYLWCTASTAGGKWSCKCSATYRIVSLKSGTKNLIGKTNDHLFNNEGNAWGFGKFIAFAELMDPSKGLYDQNEDKVTLAVDIFVEEETVEKFELNPNKSNGTIEMEIDKLSEFAREILGSGRNSESAQIKGIPWKISAKIISKNEDKTKKYLGFGLECSPQKDSNWSCEQFHLIIKL